VAALQVVCWMGLQNNGCNCMLGVNIKFHGKVRMIIHAAFDSCVCVFFFFLVACPYKKWAFCSYMLELMCFRMCSTSQNDRNS
jgi:hypothetical protein